MLIGIGTDLVDSRRVARLLAHHGQRFLSRVFTPTEQLYCLQQPSPALALAKRFAAKEAFAKALGWGIGTQLSWGDVGIVSGARGEPQMQVSSVATQRISESFGAFHVKVSLSDESPYALAFVVMTSASFTSVVTKPACPSSNRHSLC